MNPSIFFFRNFVSIVYASLTVSDKPLAKPPTRHGLR